MSILLALLLAATPPKPPKPDFLMNEGWRLCFKRRKEFHCLKTVDIKELIKYLDELETESRPIPSVPPEKGQTWEI